MISGKWKILILWYVSFYKVQRFGELMRRLDGITQSTLTKQLRELESDGFLHREIYKEIPPKVEYSLAEFGESFIPVFQTMMTWSETYPCPDYQNPYENAQAKQFVIRSSVHWIWKIFVCRVNSKTGRVSQRSR